jgi:hypothetical protein
MRDMILSDAKTRGYQIDKIDATWPFDFNGNEAYLITNLKMERIYICFCSHTGKILAKRKA